MSKERLEELAYNVGISLDGDKALMSSDDYDFLYNYALEQAERAEELEEDSKDAKFAIDMLQAENQRYKRALEFYQNGLNYTWKDGLSPVSSSVMIDGGFKARQALEREVNG